MAAAAVTFESLKGQLAKGQYAPIYLLHGEEGYYIDRLAKMFEEIVPEEERDFNLYTLYAPEVTMGMVMETCGRYPMMAERQVVILKEAQAIAAAQLNRLHLYASHLSPTTILVICCRGAQAKGKELLAQIPAHGGVIFESKRVTDYMLPRVINGYVKECGMSIEPKATEMLAEFVGSDLSTLHNEIDKLALILGKGSMVTPEAIERNIGISKDYNNFELVAALACRDTLRAFRIVDHFRMNPKNNPTVLTASALFAYFSDLLLLYFCKDKTPSGYMAEIKLKWPKQLERFTAGMRNYNAFQAIEIISAIRDFDRKSKGVDSRQNEYALLHELVFHIVSAPGNIAV